MKLTESPRTVQSRRLYAALRQAGYLNEESEAHRFTTRLNDALHRLGFLAVVLAEEDVSVSDLAEDTQLLGGDATGDR